MSEKMQYDIERLPKKMTSDNGHIQQGRRLSAPYHTPPLETAILDSHSCLGVTPVNTNCRRGTALAYSASIQASQASCAVSRSHRSSTRSQWTGIGGSLI